MLQVLLLFFILLYVTYHLVVGAIATNASNVCQCGIPSIPSHSWSYDGGGWHSPKQSWYHNRDVLIDDSLMPDMYISDTG